MRSAASRGDSPSPAATPRSTSANLRTASPSAPSGDAERTPNGNAPSLVIVSGSTELVRAGHDRRRLVVAREPFACDDGVGLCVEHGPHTEAVTELGRHERVGREHDRAWTRNRRTGLCEQREIGVRIGDRGDEVELVEPARLADDHQRARLVDREQLGAGERGVPFGVEASSRDHCDVLAQQVHGGHDLHAARRRRCHR